MGLQEIKDWQVALNDDYDNVTRAINMFLKNPTRGNRKIIQEHMKEFNKTKGRLVRNINDFWCKGE